MLDNQDDEDLQLSELTLAALNEFYSERQKNSLNHRSVAEDWELSQFWYTDKTADILKQECLRLAGNGGKIGCISCPTVYKLIHECTDGPESYLFEYDRRFEQVYGDSFVYYDYQEPISGFRQDFNHYFDVLIVDPPFLSEECLTKVAESVKFLSKLDDKCRIILCTGAIMEPLAKQLLNVEPCNFVPLHERKLANEFKCYVNYSDTDFLNNCSAE